MKYTARYEREADGRWTVEVPEVKGCHTYGRTIDQINQIERKELEEVRGALIERGRAPRSHRVVRRAAKKRTRP